MEVQASGPTYYALLVGIDSYPKDHSPLNSCARDVREISKCLEKNTPATLHTTVLVAAAEDDPPDPAGHQEGRPTYPNVMSSLQRITEQAEAGDMVYIHYSGHGTRVPPGRRNAFSNHNTGDLAWVVLQDSEAGVRVRYLHGSHLAQKIRGMVAKGLRVTLVLDCCHAGSVMRDDAADDVDARFLEYDADIDAAFPSEAHEEDINPSRVPDLLPGARYRAYRDVSMLPSWMIDPEGFSIITACGPHEIARHIRLESGALHGRLSYFLIETLQGSDPGGFRGQFGDIYERLRTKFLQHFPMQNPMWYGNRQHEFFKAVPMSGPAWQSSGPTYPVTKQPDGRLQLEGGQAHGIYNDDKFDILELGCSAVVKKVRGLTSDLDIVSLDPPNVSEGKGWRAKARTTFSLRQYPVLLKLGLPDTDEVSHWEEIRSKRPWLRISFNENELHDPPFFRVNSLSASGSEGYEILDASNEAFKQMDTELLNPDQTLDAVEHLAKFRLFHDLSHESSLSLPCNVRLVNIKSGKTFNPGVVAEATQNDRLNLTVDNQGSDIFYVHLYNLRPCWDIMNIFKGSYDVLHPRSHPKEPGSVRTTFKRQGRRSYGISVTIPEELIRQGQQECVSVIKVLITKRPTSFEPLALPKIGEALSYKAPAPRGEEDEQNMDDSEHWVALNFYIRICMGATVTGTSH
ncbi:hypothetical protein AAE478_007515 [Parahypoxylon ruwenzoriense]